MPVSSQSNSLWEITKIGTDYLNNNPTMTSARLYGRLLSYAKPYWPGFAFAALAMLVTAGTETAFPALLKPLLDNGFAGASAFQVWWVPTAVLLIFLLRGV